MSKKYSKEDNSLMVGIEKESHKVKDLLHKQNKIDHYSKIADSIFNQYKQTTNIQQIKANKNYKSLYESLLVKPNNLAKSSIISDGTKSNSKRNKSKQSSPHHSIQGNYRINHSSKSKNKNEAKISMMTISNNFTSYHHKNKSSVIAFNKPSESKEKSKVINLIKTDAFKKIVRENNNNDQVLMQPIMINISKKGLINHNEKKCNNNKESHPQPLIVIPNDKTININNTKGIKTISRSNSISNLDKTSTEATTASKRMNDHIMKLSKISKPSFMQNNFNMKLKKDFVALYSSQINNTIKSIKNQKKRKRKISQQLNMSNSVNHKNCTYLDTNANINHHHILNTEEEGFQSTWYNNNQNYKNNNSNITTTMGNNDISTIENPKRYQENHKGFYKTSCAQGKKSKSISENILNNLLQSKQNDNNNIRRKESEAGSLSLLSEDSAFNNSKHRSTSGNNHNSIGGNQNDSSSVKQNSNKHSSNNDTIERRSISKEKSNSANDIDPTVSYTYSDDDITGQKSRRSKRNIGRVINNEDFYSFYTQMNQKLFGLNMNINDYDM